VREYIYYIEIYRDIFMYIHIVPWHQVVRGRIVRRNDHHARASPSTNPVASQREGDINLYRSISISISTYLSISMYIVPWHQVVRGRIVRRNDHHARASPRANPVASQREGGCRAGAGGVHVQVGPARADDLRKLHKKTMNTATIPFVTLPLSPIP